MTPRLTDPFPVGPSTAPSRVVFGPHETNLGDGRALSARHLAYYTRRAVGGAGIIVTETASVTDNDWPYERAPLASRCGPGWQALARACAAHGTLLLAGIGHAGGQGSSAFSQEVMWAPSRVADVVTREPPAELEEGAIALLVSAFAVAAQTAMEAGLAGVEIDAGAFSLLRQFHSGLTNLRDDRFGSDRLLFTRKVIAAVRRAVGPTGVVALRLSCDELAPWAGVTAEHSATMVADLADSLDLLTVVRAGPYSTTAYRPDAHTPAGFNQDLCRAMRQAAAGSVPVVLQGSVVDPAMAAAALEDATCDAVEMTRALIADATLVAKLGVGHPERIRPCILCNQACRVRDNRNPLVSCVLDPASGHETEEPFEAQPESRPPGSAVLIVGSGPAGLECARILSGCGVAVRVADRAVGPGGSLARAARGPGRENLRMATDWLHREALRLGAAFAFDHHVDTAEIRRWLEEGGRVVLATGSRPLTNRYRDAGTPVVDTLSALSGEVTLAEGPAVVLDPVGDSVGVGMAEWLAGEGRAVTIVCPDPVAGTQLARTGDLADANGRLQRAGVDRQLRKLVRNIGAGRILVEDAWTGEQEEIEAGVVIDCGHRLPDDELYLQLDDPAVARAGDCIAPRSLLEAVLEGRRVALGFLGISTGPDVADHLPGSPADPAAEPAKAPA